MVNNLNGDNEILTGDIDDLKHAFFFLYEKHKVLMRNYQKECYNRSLIANQRLRIEELQMEMGVLSSENLNLRTKVASMFDVIRLSWQEHESHSQEIEAQMIQLEMENHHLRSLIAL